MTFAARVALFFALLAMLPAAVLARDDTSTFLDRMRDRSGPVWRTHLHSTSHISVNNAAVAIATDTFGPRFFFRQCDGPLCMGTYFDGLRTYTVNINDTALPAGQNVDEFLRAARIVASLSFLAPDFSDRGGTVEDEGLVSIDGSAYRDLLVSAPQATAVDVYVNPETYLVRYARDVNATTTLAYSDYRRVGAVTLPFVVTKNGAPLEHYDTRDALDTPFPAPAGVAPRFAHVPAVVALDTEHSTPVFPCTIGGIAVHCLLDSGNSGLSMSLELAEKLNAQPIGAFSVHGLGEYATEVVRAGPLAVGGMTVPDAKYVVLHDIERFGYDVVLGADILASTSVQIDHSHHTIAFGATQPRDGVLVPLQFENFVPVIDVGLGDQRAELALDTGDESTINLSYAFYRAHPNLFSATEQRGVSGVGGTGVELIGEIPVVHIGTLAVKRQQIGTTTTMQSTASGHVGAGFLQQFLITIDYQDGSLRLAPASAGRAPANR